MKMTKKMKKFLMAFACALLVFIFVSVLSVRQPKATVYTYFGENKAAIKQTIYENLDSKHVYIKSIQLNETSVVGKYADSGDAGGIPYAPHYEITFKATVNHNKNYVLFSTFSYPEMTAEGFLWMKKPNPYDGQHSDEMSLDKADFNFSEKDLSVKEENESWWNQLPSVWGKALLSEDDKNSEIYQQLLSCYVSHQAAILAYLENVGKIGVTGSKFQSVTDSLGPKAESCDKEKQTLTFVVDYHPNTFDSYASIQMKFTITKADVDDVNRPISGFISSSYGFSTGKEYGEQVFQASHLTDLPAEVEEYMKQ